LCNGGNCHRLAGLCEPGESAVKMNNMNTINIVFAVIMLCLGLGLRPMIANAQTPDATGQANDAASAAEGVQLVAAPALVAPAHGAATTGVTDPPVGVPALVWDAVAGATKYSVQVSTSAGFASPVVDATTTGLSYTPLIVLKDGEYFWRVRAYANKEWGPFSNAYTFHKDWSDNGVLVPLLTSPPDGAERTAFAPDDFSWLPVAGAATYLLEIGSDASFSTVLYSAQTITPHHMPAQRLATNTYYWRVTPLDARGNAGRPSNVNRFLFRWNTAPELLTPDDGIQTPFVPTFTWTAVEGAKIYRLEVDTEEDFSSPSLYTSKNTAFVWERNLSNDAEYFWRVQAVDEAGNSSEWSPRRSFRMRWNFKPQLLAPANNSLLQSYPVFYWTPIPGIERYHVQVDESLSFGQPLFDSKVYNNHTATIVRFNESTIYIGASYYWRVRGIDAQGNLTPWSDIFSFQFGYITSPNLVYPLPYFVPDIATLPVHDDHTIPSPLFVWDTVHTWFDYEQKSLSVGPDYYELAVATDATFEINKVVFQIETAGLAAAPTLENRFSGDTNGQLYYWRVRAWRNGQILGSETVRLMRIDTGAARLSVIGAISPTHPADGFEAVGDAPVLGWLPVNGAANYKIEISHDRTFTVVDEAAHPQFINYTPGQGRRTPLPFGAYWWRVRAESAPDTPLTDWSPPRHFNLSVDLVTGNSTDFVTPTYPGTLLTLSASPTYSATYSLVATNTLPAADDTAVDNLHVMLNRVNLHSSNGAGLNWVIAFSTATTLPTSLRYGIYVDVDHIDGEGASFDPEGHPITVDPFYRPEYALYVDADQPGGVSPQFIRLHKWNGAGWNFYQTLESIGGDAWYDAATSAVQLVVPYTAIGAGDEDFSGSLAMTVFSTEGEHGVLDSVPATYATGDNPVLDNPVFVSDMLLPLHPFDTPFSNPIVYYELPTLRWRMPYFDSVDGYQLEIARDIKFTDIVETWEISEQSKAPYFAALPAAFQSLNAYQDNESYYWRVRIRHERYDANSSHFDYGPWSPPSRFKLASRLVGNPTVSTGELANTTPAFWWDRVEAAAGYTIQIDNDANFSNPEVNKKIDPNSFTLLEALADGVWYWRVAIRRADGVRGVWTPTMSFVKSSLTPAPLSPPNGAIINEQPTFQWSAILTPTVQPRVATPRYRLQIAADANFSNPKNVETAATSFTLKPVDSLSDGPWYWRVAAIDGNGNLGAYGPAQQFYKEYVRPALLMPAQGATATNQVSFRWSPLFSAAYYEVEIDDDPLFNSPIKAKTENTQYTPTEVLSPNPYYWRVRMVDTDRQAGPFEVGLVTIQPPIDPAQAQRVYLSLIWR
jgi:hypothetical protein